MSETPQDAAWRGEQAMAELMRIVEEFHCKCRRIPRFANSVPDAGENPYLSSCVDMVQEEFNELLLASTDADVADAIADLIFVLVGFALASGCPLHTVFGEVCGANLEKIGGPMRSDGKILKPGGWRAPDVETALLATVDDALDGWPQVMSPDTKALLACVLAKLDRVSAGEMYALAECKSVLRALLGVPKPSTYDNRKS